MHPWNPTEQQRHSAVRKALFPERDRLRHPLPWQSLPQRRSRLPTTDRVPDRAKQPWTHHCWLPHDAESQQARVPARTRRCLPPCRQGKRRKCRSRMIIRHVSPVCQPGARKKHSVVTERFFGAAGAGRHFMFRGKPDRVAQRGSASSALVASSSSLPPQPPGAGCKPSPCLPLLARIGMLGTRLKQTLPLKEHCVP